MKINDFILQNEKLSSQMKIFSDEIDRLEQLRDLFKKKPDQDCGPNPDLSGVLARKLNRAKEQFTILNESYDEIAHKSADINTSGFISEAAEEIKEIQQLFSNIRYERSY